MARLRHLLISVGVCGLLAACDRGAVPAAASQVAKPQVAKPQVAANSHALEVPAALPADDGWKSQVPSITATDIKDTLRQADDALARGQLDQDRSPGPGALELYLAVLALEPGNAHARSGVQSTLDALIEHGRLATRVGRFADARRVVRIAEELLPRHPDLAGFRLHVAKAQKAATWVAKAEAAAKRGRFTEPAGESALDYFMRASQAYPDFEPAALQRKRVNKVLLGRAWKSAMVDEFAEADARLLESERLLPASGDARVMGLRIVELRGAVTATLLSRGNQAVDRMRLDRARGFLMRAQRMAAQPHGVEALRERIHLARHYGPFKPGQAFAEKLDSGASAPEMVVIPYGTGTMGSGDDDSAAKAGENQRMSSSSSGVSQSRATKSPWLISGASPKPPVIARLQHAMGTRRFMTSAAACSASTRAWTGAATTSAASPPQCCRWSTWPGRTPLRTRNGFPRRPARSIDCQAKLNSSTYCAPAAARSIHGGRDDQAGSWET